MKVEIGDNLKLDVIRLCETRLLVQGSSGSGKSMTLRTILEKTFGIIPHIVLDIEGEFSTLREKYDYILAGKGGDIPADVRTAQMLARKMLELNASVIVDLYELKPSEKHRFVRLFLETLIEAPKELWGPRLVLVDEAHHFCPEKGDHPSEASEFVIDLCSRGRKRGLGAILATQRLSKLNKDAAAECQNKIIGLANIDIDRERSARELGFTKREDITSLRDLSPGEFYAIGPALCHRVQKVKILEAKTSHPKIGKRTVKAPVATAKVRTLLEKLKDLPKEAQEEAKTIDELKKKNFELQRELKVERSKEVQKVVAELPEKELLKLRDEYHKAAEKLSLEFDRRKLGAIKDALVDMKIGVQDVINQVVKKHSGTVMSIPEMIQAPKPKIEVNTTPKLIYKFSKAEIDKAEGNLDISEDKPLGGSEKDILGFLSLHPEQFFRKQQIGAMIRKAWKGGSFNTYISRLRQKGFVEGSGAIKITQEGLDYAASNGLANERDNKVSLENWLTKLGGGTKKIYEVLLSDPSRGFTKEEIREQTQMVCTGGSFNTYVSRLCTLGLAKKENGLIKLNPDIQGL